MWSSWLDENDDWPIKHGDLLGYEWGYSGIYNQLFDIGWYTRIVGYDPSISEDVMSHDITYHIMDAGSNGDI
jgi:hypothetical protein